MNECWAKGAFNYRGDLAKYIYHNQKKKSYILCRRVLGVDDSKDTTGSGLSITSVFFVQTFLHFFAQTFLTAFFFAIIYSL
jgi:hypothetical protein